MPTTITQLFNQAGLTISGQVKWGQIINSRACGFYVVALTNNADELVCTDKPNFSDEAIKQWIELVKSGGKQIQLDNRTADLDDIKKRLEKFWFADETIVYIGKAGPKKSRTIRKRVKEYYETPLGCDKKHAGGNWVNTMINVSSLNVFYSEYSGIDIEEKEETMISYFMENVSETTKANLYDKVNCYPFANKELYRKSLKSKTKKVHGLNYQTIDCTKL